MGEAVFCVQGVFMPHAGSMEKLVLKRGRDGLNRFHGKPEGNGVFLLKHGENRLASGRYECGRETR